ncbi:MAG: hypothetical protein G8D91_09160 [gamma proteobacterium symbiont of Clathrolucina costata]
MGIKKKAKPLTQGKTEPAKKPTPKRSNNPKPFLDEEGFYWVDEVLKDDDKFAEAVHKMEQDIEDLSDWLVDWDTLHQWCARSNWSRWGFEETDELCYPEEFSSKFETVQEAGDAIKSVYQKVLSELRD